MKQVQTMISICILILMSSCASIFGPSLPPSVCKLDPKTRHAYRGVTQFLDRCISEGYPVSVVKFAKIDTLIVHEDTQHIDIYFNNWFECVPYREENTRQIYDEMKKDLGTRFGNYTLTIYADKQEISRLIPNYFRSDASEYDSSRMPAKDKPREAFVTNLSKPWLSDSDLYGRNIAVWPSHGWYYERSLNRWEWQRARVFQTVEDLLPMSFVVPYLEPMLENAGAHVFIPRERDFQTHEIIVDNDGSMGSSAYKETNASGGKIHTNKKGFAIGHPPYQAGENPFLNGTSRIMAADTNESAEINWTPDIPETGEYAVYISYAVSDSNVSDAHYSVYHDGGKSEFRVNQAMGGGTWTYLGKFKFSAGKHPESGRVQLTNESRDKGKTVSADAVRFGGGMGNVARGGMISGRPRFTEAARYYLQYAGMPDTLVYNFMADSNDYRDDYLCRGEWVDYLTGAPNGPRHDPDNRGLQIPIDLSLGFHTDDGITRNDTVVGTLMIYSSRGANSPDTFPDGMSRLANRDLGDIMQTQLVQDLRAKYDAAWNRRWLWDRPYSEAFSPNVPAVLLELLSHHNYLDMKFALDPRFRFDVSRALYKSMLRFIATQHHSDYTVQPLPVTHFQAEFTDEYQIQLKWKAQPDPLEASALPDKYIVYTRMGKKDFDNGQVVQQEEFTLKGIKPGVIYSFRVSAVNAGGESFPSEILSACRMDTNRKEVLIINGFDRISGPATIETDQYLGFADFWDQGVPDKFDMNFVGNQYDFNADSPQLDDDAPGHGASYNNYANRIIAGNTFDYPFIHGQSLKNCGYSFVSASNESVMDGDIDLRRYRYADLILGEEKDSDWPKAGPERQFRTFPEKMQNQLSRYTENGGNLFISGAYVGSGLSTDQPDSMDIKFAKHILNYTLRTDHVVQDGGVHSTDTDFFPQPMNFEFNTRLNPDIYAAESADAIEAVAPAAKTILRYSENNSSAAVAFRGRTSIIVFAFPFETILERSARDQVMKSVLNYFNAE